MDKYEPDDVIVITVERDQRYMEKLDSYIIQDSGRVRYNITYQSLSGIIGFVCGKNFCFIGHRWNSNLFCHGNRQNIYGLLTISSANAILILTCFVRYVCYGTLYSP